MASNSFWDTGLGKFLNIITFGIPRIIQGVSQPGKNEDGSSNSAAGVFNQQNWQNTAGDILLGDDYQNNQPLGQQLFGTNLGGLIQSLTNRITASELTGAEREANAFSAEQAQIDRAFQERMANTQYQRGVADMRAAGVNPALAIGQGGAAAPSGQAASSVNPQGSAFNLGELFQLMMIKPQMELMRKQGDAAVMQGQAALKNAGTNAVNAETGQGRLDVERYDAETRRMLANNQIRVGDSTITLNESKVAEIAQAIKESESRIELQDLEKLAKNLDYQFDREMYDTNKALLIQQLAYRAVEMSNLRQLTAESAKRIELMSNEQAGSQWMSDHPKLAAGIGIAGGLTGVIGNVLKGSVSGVIGRWSKQ